MADIDAFVRAAVAEKIVVRILKEHHQGEDQADPSFRTISAGPGEKSEPEDNCMLHLSPGADDGLDHEGSLNTPGCSGQWSGCKKSRRPFDRAGIAVVGVHGDTLEIRP